jgi:hypothetical protein
MSRKIGTQLIMFGAATFGLWYFMRRTSIGAAYSQDMWNLPHRLGVAEGLRSAREAFRQ